MNEMHIQITGIKDEDVFTKQTLDSITTGFADRVGKFYKESESLDVVVKKHNPTGKIKYSVHAKMQTPLGMFVAQSSGFEKLPAVLQGCLDNLVKEIRKKHDRLAEKG